MEPELATALELHKARLYADAAQRYHAILTRQPNHAEALSYFGVMHHECGQSARAVELIGRAIALKPHAAQLHGNLAEVYRALGRHEDACECWRNFLRLDPQSAAAHNNLGVVLLAMQRPDEAANEFRAALAIRPGFALAQNNLGNALRELGQAAEALEAFRLAVKLDPNAPIARANLGQAFNDADRADEGLRHCQEAVRLAPGMAAGHNNLGNALRLLGRWSEARAAYAEALRLSAGPESARFQANLGLTFEQEGNLTQALACYQKAVDLAPDNPTFWQCLASAHAANEDSRESLRCRDRVVALWPTDPQAHTDRAWALREERRVAEAASCYERALTLDPGHVEALVGKAGLLEELGATGEAEDCYRHARQTNPQAPAPLAWLASLQRSRLPESERAAILALLDDPALAPGPRADLLFGLAHVADGRASYSEAAAWMNAANAAAAQERGRRNLRYDAAEHKRAIDGLIEGFTPAVFERLAHAGDTTPEPVFVYGMPRSGTTLVEQVLASHPQVHGAGELNLARRTFQAIPAAVGRQDEIRSCVAALGARELDALGRRHLTELRRLVEVDQPGRVPARVVDKMPDNYLYMGILVLLFPRATFIHVRRDPRDVALSCWLTNFRIVRWANDRDHIAGRIREHARLTEHWRRVLPMTVNIHEVAYEQLIRNFPTEARRLVESCGLDWDSRCLQFHETARPIRTASVTQVRQPLYSNSIGRWKHYEEHLRDLFECLPQL